LLIGSITLTLYSLIHYFIHCLREFRFMNCSIVSQIWTLLWMNCHISFHDSRYWKLCMKRAHFSLRLYTIWNLNKLTLPTFWKIMQLFYQRYSSSESSHTHMHTLNTHPLILLSFSSSIFSLCVCVCVFGYVSFETESNYFVLFWGWSKF
jgi:hypothetical protein